MLSLSSLLLLLLPLLLFSMTPCFDQDRKLAEALLGSREEHEAILQVSTRLSLVCCFLLLFSLFLLLQRACRRHMIKGSEPGAFCLLLINTVKTSIYLFRLFLYLEQPALL